MPRQVSKWLADKDANAGGTSDSKPVLKEKNEIMAGVNFGGRSQTEILGTDFWTDVYLPFITEDRRHSTVSGHTQPWEKLLQPQFTGKTLGDYQTHQGSEFLTGLTKKYGERSLHSLASGIFTLAQ